jgi:hypothetical protein
MVEIVCEDTVIPMIGYVPKLRRAQFDCELARPNGGVQIRPYFSPPVAIVEITSHVRNVLYQHLSLLTSLFLTDEAEDPS